MDHCWRLTEESSRGHQVYESTIRWHHHAWETCKDAWHHEFSEEFSKETLATSAKNLVGSSSRKMAYNNTPTECSDDQIIKFLKLPNLELNAHVTSEF